MTDRNELIAMVNALLPEAVKRGDEVSMALLSALGERLVAEAKQEKMEHALDAMADDVGVHSPGPCPVCERRRAAKLASQQKWRAAKREGKPKNGRRKHKRQETHPD
jgi:hypothetical protein